MKSLDEKFYKENGYVILKSVLSEIEISNIQSDIHKIIRQQLIALGQAAEFDSSIDSIYKDMVKLHALDINKYLSSLRLCAKVTSLYQAVLNKRILDFTNSIGIEMPVFQTQPVFHIMSDKLKIKDGYFGVGAHQDWPALQSGLDTVTTWVPLVPVKANTYTLEIVPKSHLLGFCESKQEQNIHEIIPSAYSHLNFVKVEMNPGDVLVFSVFLIHKSELEAESNAFRMAYSMRYENGADATFIKRNYPFAQKRVVERALADTDVPKLEDVQRVFNR